MSLHVFIAAPYTLTAYWCVCPYVQSVIIQSHTLAHWDGVATSQRSHTFSYPLRWCFVCVDIGLAVGALSTLLALLPVSAEHAATITNKTLSVLAPIPSPVWWSWVQTRGECHTSVWSQRGPCLAWKAYPIQLPSTSHTFSAGGGAGGGGELCWHMTRVLWHCVCNSMCACVRACVFTSHCTSGPTWMYIQLMSPTVDVYMCKYCKCMCMWG